MRAARFVHLLTAVVALTLVAAVGVSVGRAALVPAGFHLQGALAPEILGESEGAEEAVRLARAGRFGPALAAADAALAAGGAQALSATERRGLENLRARCLFELGDYPECERQLRSLIETSPPRSAERGELLARLAEALSCQWIHDEAARVLLRALEESEDPRIRRVGVTISLRARRFEEVGRHASALLAREPRDPFGHFAMGIALSKQGKYEEAKEELRWGLQLPGAFRDAHFELAIVASKQRRPAEALEHLREILVRDPFDEEACYQASQQLIHLRTRNGLETGAHLTRYLEALKDAAGPSSRDHHYQAAGRTAAASMERAARWERLGDYRRSIEEIQRAEAVAPADPDVGLYAAALWARMGLLAEAARTLDDLATMIPAGASSAKERVEEARTKLRSEEEQVRGLNGDLAVARSELAAVPWSGSEAALENVILSAARDGDSALATRAARLLLALRPDSRAGLEYLAASTSDPSLLVPHAYYLTRLAEVAPDDAKVKERLDRARARLLGR